MIYNIHLPKVFHNKRALCKSEPHTVEQKERSDQHCYYMHIPYTGHVIQIIPTEHTYS